MKSLVRWSLLLLSIFAGGSSYLFANDLTVTNLSRDSLAGTVSFDLRWSNSWRLDGVQAPFNWDAAWIFVKFRDCDASATDPWQHARLSGNLADHNFGGFDPVLSDGSATGLDPDLRGAMLRRGATGLFGAMGAASVTLRLTNLNPNTAYHIRVVGIEMVYVVPGAFEVGGITASNAFSANTITTDNTPFSLASEAAVTINSHAGGVNASVSLAAGFPKGTAGFHLMKYEITQGQYAAFLNSLAPTQQFTRYPGNFNNYRQRLAVGNPNPLDNFVSDRPDRAQNYLSWDDVMAYLDWAALRPITELEYEKAARGQAAAVDGEYAWGTINLYELTDITAPEDGTELPAALPANAHYQWNNIAGGDGGLGPVRVGIMALPANTTREQSGASLYGIMELSGNVWEACVVVNSITATGGTVAYAGTYGDGDLDANADANAVGWPTEASGGFIARGGSFADVATDLRVADRTLVWNGTRTYQSGGRGGR